MEASRKTAHRQRFLKRLLIVSSGILLLLNSTSFAIKKPPSVPDQFPAYVSEIRSVIKAQPALEIPAPNLQAKQVEAEYSILQKKNDQPVNITLSKFAKPVKIARSNFNKPVLIRLSTFHAPVTFDRVKFNAGLEVYWSNFLARFYMHTVETTTINFNYDTFNEDALFYWLEVKQQAQFLGVVWKKAAIFKRATFHKGLNFSHNEISGMTDFSNAEIKQSFISSSTDYKGNVSFDQAVFGRYATFYSDSFGGTVSFKHTKLPKKLNFSEVTSIESAINLRQATPSDPNTPTKINLYQANISKILINYVNFKLYFPSNATPEKTKETYEALLKQFTDDGLKDSYNTMYKEFRAYEYLSEGRTVANAFQRGFWEYGLDKGLAMLWFLYIFIFFIVLNIIFYEPLTSKYCNFKFVNPELGETSEGDQFFLMKILKNAPKAVFFSIYIYLGAFLRLGFKPQDVLKTTNSFINSYVILQAVIGFATIFLIFKII